MGFESDLCGHQPRPQGFSLKKKKWVGNEVVWTWPYWLFLSQCTMGLFGTVSLLSLGSFSNDDGDGNEDVKKAVGLLRKTTTLHVHLAFLYIPFHEYDVKMSNCKFYGGRAQATTNLFLSLS